MYDPDFELVRQAKAGDKSAFGKLVTCYYEMVYVVVFGVVSNAEVARDLTQDVFLKIYRDLARFEGKSKFKTWLYRIAVNAAIDQIRRKRPSVSLEGYEKDGESVPIQIPDCHPGPSEQASRSEWKQRIEAAINKLSPEHRAVLVLREWQGLSYDEIAETLNVQIGTVMSRLYYARKKLTEVLKPFHDSERKGK